MQISKTLLVTLAAVASVIAAPAGSDLSERQTTCTGGTYDTCVASYFCTLIYPQSCYCFNNIKTNCAAVCKAPAPVLEVCPPLTTATIAPTPTTSTATKTLSTTKASTSCIGGSYTACVGSFACIQSYPESCYCANSIKVKCGALCLPGVVIPTATCPALTTI